jgi:cytidine deaminase
MTYAEMYEIAKSKLNPQKLNKHAKMGDAVCVIETKNGEIYCGVSLIVSGNVGFCAEQGAIAEMIKDGETVIKRALIIDKFHHIFPPCGKCRELISAINRENKNAEFYVSSSQTVMLYELLPYDWKDIKDNELFQ